MAFFWLTQLHPNLHNIIFQNVTPLLYPKTLGNGCAQSESPSLLLYFPPIYVVMGFNIKLIHQRIQFTRLHTSCCHRCNCSQY